MTAETIGDGLRLNQAMKVEKYLGERDAASTRLSRIASALRENIMAVKEKIDKTANTLSMVGKLCQQARAEVVGFRASWGVRVSK